MIAAKRAHLDEIVGQLKGEKEEEPEGEVLGDSDTGSLLYSSSDQFTDPIHTGICLYCLFLFCSPSDDSEEEEGKGRPHTQEEEDIDVIRSWMEVGGHPARQEEEAQGLLAEVIHIPLSLSLFIFFSLTYLLPISLTIFDASDCYVLFPPSLQGLRLLQGASEKREEARKLEAEAESMETVGWGKLREAMLGSKAEGLYGLLRGVTLHSHHLLSQPPPSRPHPCPSSPVPQKLPQESIGPKVSDPIGPASTSAPVATISVSEGDLLVDMQPLRIQLGGAKSL